ncbi:2-dehydro-3-deoxygalactonokinase [Celeribacter naphthalenivorans]|uniref:2-dehydro-3-deoxygalactonokinase n=1 Tax=Celeribacter naphthalenivorans TaxID=1614694 RepID=UPI001CFAD4B6|nr:2-dehydro-3-deoxygalactonokinase [Celeribacter naphthalenivorans]
MTTRIAVDWGTSALRLWALDAAGTPMVERRSDKGMGRLSSEAFEPAFLEIAEDLLAEDGPTQVLICGMAGARDGWCEAPYRATPARLTAPEATRVPTQDARLDVRILGGVSQAEPADVMRGEETQIAGFLVNDPAFDGTLCLPGTHTKWVQVSDGTIQDFCTVMTGELFALLSRQSVLRRSVESDAPLSMPSFSAAVREAVEQPERLTAALFSLRAEGLVAGLRPEMAKSRLSGLLIGQELAATRARWLGRSVTIIGDDSLAELYRSALETLGTVAHCQSGSALSLLGLGAAFDTVFSPDFSRNLSSETQI